MDYLKGGIDFIRKNPKKSSIIIGLDILFYILFIPIFNFFISLVSSQISRVPIQMMGKMMESYETGQQLSSILVSVFVNIIVSVILFFLFIFLNIAIIKTIIWVMTFDKKIDWQRMWKSVLAVIIMAIIFVVPVILSWLPLIKDSEAYAKTQVIGVGLAEFIPFILVSFIMMYFTTLAIAYIAKEGRLRRGLKNCFVQGIMRVGKLILPFIGLYVVFFAMGKLLRDLGLLVGIYGIGIFFIVIVMVSFFNRVYLKEEMSD